MICEVELALGSNLGDKKKNLAEALFFIENNLGTIIEKTKIVETKPWGYYSDNNFFNMIVKIKTSISPMKLLEEIKRIEKTIGRKEKTGKLPYEDRLIDIDILRFGKTKVISKKLILPHQKIKERDFFNFTFYKN